MFSTQDYVQEKGKKSGRGRFEYLQALVTEFQDTDKQESKVEVLANLANFAYDPINYEHLRKLNVVDLFLDMLSEENDKLMEFGIAGLCNLCLDEINREHILKNDGVESIIGCLSSSNEETVLNAITTLMYLVTPESKAEIVCEQVKDCMVQLTESKNPRLKNLALIFLEGSRMRFIDYEASYMVVVITHAYGQKKGIHYLKNLKIYYLPFGIFYNNCVLPTIYSTFPTLRKIFIREQITIVHGHSAFSTLCHDALVHGKTMSLKTVFTDHSLFGFADASSIITNKFLEFSLSDVDHVICVSNTSKENTVLRASLYPDIVSVIPNAVESTLFLPDPSRRHKDKVTLVVMSRIVYRKGVDLLVGIIPKICEKFPEVQFLIGGDGPRKILIEELIEKYQLHERVLFMGELQHNEVRDVLVQGDIFLNTSLTEAFCMAIVEAASCGLKVVSTNVGGIPEVLPPGMIYLCEPSIKGLNEAVEKAISDHQSGHFPCSHDYHDRIKSMYTWENITSRTEKVYDLVSIKKNQTVMERMEKFRKRAWIAGKIYVLIVFIDILLLYILEFFWPQKKIKIAQTTNKKKMQ